ncbi:MBL fold metallo-hydrolase [Thermodesulfobacteriota bacterium]
MVITEAGWITERILMLGRPESCVYIVDGGDQMALIGGGMSYVVPDILRQFDQFEIEEEKIRWMIILHAHFDHCGVIPYFKKRWPWARVTGSVRAKQILSDTNISQSIAALNHAEIVRAGLEAAAKDLDFGFNGIEVEETVGEGDVLASGDLTLEVLEVPGHSSCAIAIYMPREKALFASDAAGIRCEGFVMATGNSNFDLYQQSLQKMAGYDVEVLLAAHYGVSTGEDARAYMSDSIEAAQKMRILLEESYRRHHDVKTCTQEIIDVIMNEVPDSFLSRDVFAIVVEQMVKYIAKTLEK